MTWVNSVTTDETPKSTHVRICWVEFTTPVTVVIPFFFSNLGLHHRFHRLTNLCWPVYWPNVLTRPSACTSPSPPNLTHHFIASLNSSLSFWVTHFSPILCFFDPSACMGPYSISSTTHCALLSTICLSISAQPSHTCVKSFHLPVHESYFMSDTFLLSFSTMVIAWNHSTRRERGYWGRHLTKVPGWIQTQDLAMKRKRFTEPVWHRLVVTVIQRIQSTA